MATHLQLRAVVLRLEKSRFLARLIRYLRGVIFLRRTITTDRLARPIIDSLIGAWSARASAGPRHIEIETINRCNGACSFCPVSKDADPRALKKMTESLLESILVQLGELGYDGVLSLYSNNEPLLDKRIYAFHEMARQKVANATIMLVTNGTALNVERFLQLIPNVDILRIDNYSDDMVVKPNVSEIQKYWEAHPVVGKEVSVVVRRENELRTSRGGRAPNRGEIRTLQSSCLLPFMQMIIRPDGKVSLCCNDALGENTLGDLTRQTIMEIWNGSGFRSVREKLSQGRRNIPTCAGCDTFLGPDHPELNALPAYSPLRSAAGRAVVDVERAG